MRLFLVLLFFVSSVSADQVVCGKLFSKPLPGRQFIEKEDLEKIEALFEQKSFYGRPSYFKIFEVFLRARLRTLSPEVRKGLLSGLPVVTYGLKKHFANAGSMRLPREFDGTAIPLFILAHEIEHRIQFLEWGKGKPLESLNLIIQRQLGASLVFRMEKEAMEAEWEFLSFVPRSELQRALEVVQKSSLDHEMMKAMLLNSLSIMQKDLDRDSYIRAQHHADRYSYNGILLNRTRRWAGVVLAAELAAILYVYFH